MRNIDDIMDFMNIKGYKMELAMSGFYYCTKMNDDKTITLVWCDSTCEGAYNYESALVHAYAIIKNIPVDEVLKSFKA